MKYCTFCPHFRRRHFWLHRALGVLVAVSLSQPALSEQRYFIYKIQRGETLSQILYDKFHLSPVYGPGGFISQVIKINESRIMNEGDSIWVGETILIPLIPNVNETLAVRELASEDVNKVKLEIEKRIQNAESGHSPPGGPDEETTSSKPPPRLSNFEFSFGGGYTGIQGEQKSNGSKAILASGLSPIWSIGWNTQLSPTFTSKFYLKSETIRIQNDLRGTSVQNEKLSKYTLGYGISQELSRRLIANLNAEIAQDIFYTGLTGGGILVQQVPILRVHPQLELILVRKLPFEVSTLVGVSYFDRSNYDNYSISSGTGTDIGFQMKQKFLHSEFRCKVEYSQRNQSTSYLSLIEKNMSLICTYAIGI